MPQLHDPLGEYPEHAKMMAVKPLADAGGKLLEWLVENGYVLCHVPTPDDVNHSQSYIPAYEPTENILATWLGIDLAAIDREKRTMLEATRAYTAAAEAVAELELAASPLNPPVTP